MATDGGEVQVRLSQSGADDVIRALQGIKDGIESVGSTATMGAVGALAGGITAVAEEAKKAFEAFKEVATGIGEMAAKMIEVRNEEEQLQIKLASLNEKTLGWAGAMQQATSNLDALVKMSAKESLPELVTVFQRLTLLVGGTDTSLRDLTQRMVAFAEASGVTAEQLLRVVQMAERTGTLPMRGQMAVASLALQRAGISGTDIREAALGGTLDELLQKLNLSAEAMETVRNSWANLVGDLDRAKTSVMGIIGEAFEPLKEVLKAMRDNLADDTFKRDLREIVAAFKELGTAVVELRESMGGEAMKGMFTWFKEKIREQVQDWIVYIDNLRIASELLKGIAGAAQGDVGAAGAANEAIKDIIARENERIARLNQHGASGSWDDATVHVPIGPETVKQIRDADEALQKLYDDADRKLELAGLEGLDRKLKEIQLSAEKEKEALDKAFQALVALHANPDPESLKSAKATVDQAAAEAEEQAKLETFRKYQRQYVAEQEKVAAERIQVETSYERTIAALEKHASDDAVEQMRATAEAQITAMDARVEKEKAALEKLYNDEKHGADTAKAAYEALMAAEGELDEKAAAFRQTIRDEELAREKELTDAQAGRWDEYYADLMKKAALAHENTFVAAQESLKKTAAAATRAAQTFEDGWRAGLLGIQASVTSFGQDTAALLDGVWHAMGTSFQEGFYDLLTGKFDSLKDVLKNLWDSILKDFSQMLADMLKRWLITGELMGNGRGTGGILGGLFSGEFGGEPGGSGIVGSIPGANEGTGMANPATGLVDVYGAGGGGAGLGAAGSVLGGAGLGLGVGSTVGGLSGAPGWSTGATIGGVAGGILASTVLNGALVSVATAIGAGAAAGTVVPIIGTIIGAIIGGLIGVLSAPNTEAHVFASGSTQEAKVAGSMTQARALDLYRASGGADAASFATSVNKYITDYLVHSQWEVHAGEAEDVAKDWKRLFTEVIPTDMLHVLFGERAVGGQDLAGISGGKLWGTAGGGRDANAPLVRMLTDLGFSADKVNEIAAKIDSYSTDPAKFMEWLNGLVGVVVGLHTNVERLGWSSSQVQADITAQASMTDAEKFSARASDLVELAKEIKLYTGDDRIQKAKDLNAAVNQYWADQEAAVKRLMDLAAQLHDSLVATMFQLQDARRAVEAQKRGVNPADYQQSESWKKLFGEHDYEGNVSQGYMDQLRFATDPAQIAALAGKAQQLITQTFDLLLKRLQQIYQLQADNATVLAAFNQNPMELGAEAMKRYGGTADWTTEGTNASYSMQEMLRKAQNTTGQEQLEWIQRIQQSAAQRYEQELKEIAQIRSNMTNLAQSVSQQKFGMAYEIADDPGKARLLAEKIKDDMKRLGTATNADEVARLTGEIQGMTGQLWGLSDKSPEAMGMINKILDDMEAAANKRYGELEAAVTSANEEIRNTLIETGKLLDAAEKTTKTALDQLTLALQQLDAIVRDKLHKSIDDLTKDNGNLGAALNEVIPLFTTLKDTLGDAGLGGAAKRTHDKFNDLNDAIDGAVTRLGDLGPGTGTTNPRAGGGNVITTIRQNPASLYTHTGV